MVTVKNVYDHLNELADVRLAEKWDNVGLMLGNYNKEVKKVLVCLDVTTKVVKEAIDKKINLIVISFHTNLDSATLGLNDYLAKLLNLNDIKVLFEHNLDNTSGLGRIGRLETPLNIKDFIKYLKDNLSLNTVSAVIGNEKDISVVALLGGSGADFIYTLPEEVDVYLTGDVGYHAALDAIEMKRNIIDIGHFAESLVKDLLLNYIAKLEVIVEKSNVEESPFKIL